MSEIDSLASFGQQSLLAERQRLTAREQQDGSPNSTAAQQVSNSVRANADAVARSARQEQQTQSDSQPQQQESRSLATRAQKAEIEAAANRPIRKPEVNDTVEIRDFDVGRRPAEVVGTFDVVQRFDGNDDGRIDILESRRAQQARDSSTTYSARANPQQDQTVAERVAEREIKEAFLAPEEPFYTEPQSAGTRPEPTDRSTEVEVRRPTGELPQQEKVYADLVREAQVETGAPDRRFEEVREAQTGLFSNEVEVDRKVFGQGVEVVRGRFADDPDVQKKLVDDAELVLSTPDGEVVQTEVRADVSVEQPERGRFYEEPQQDRKLFDDSEFSSAGAPTGEPQPKVYSELDLYADVAGLTEDNAETVVLDGPASVVRVTA